MQFDISFIKEMFTEMFNDFKGLSSSTPSSSSTIPIVTPLEATPTTKTVPEAKIIKSSSRPQLTDSIIEILPSQPSILEVQPQSSLDTNPMADRGMGIARDTDNSLRKLGQATIEVRLDPDAPRLIDYEIKREAKLITVSKLEVIKVVEELPMKLEFIQKLSKAQRVDELSVIIPKNKTKVVGELMESLSKKYERLKEILGDLGTNPSLPPPKQVPSLSLSRKRKVLELEPEVRITGLLRISGIHKVEVESLLGYMVMAGNVNTLENQRNNLNSHDVQPSVRRSIDLVTFLSCLMIKWLKVKLNNNRVEAINNEIKDFNRNNTWNITDLHVRRKPIGCKWLYKIKYKSKARLVAKEYSERDGINFDETFSHVVKIETVRTLMSLVVHYNWPLYQLDVNNSFHYSDLYEDV
nr:putative reverse transcriptase, RNA-dependent DNA polymerase, Gag-polypeptide of LTR copia-type [Tanacetum cinerariifolium]